MKLSQYAKQQGISYKMALRWWQAGLIKGYQTATKTIIVTEEVPAEAVVKQKVAIYAHVSSWEHVANLERQMERMKDYCASKGYQIAVEAHGLRNEMYSSMKWLWTPRVAFVSRQ